MRGSRSWKDFLASLEPGDMLFHRTSAKDSPAASFKMIEEMPFKESEIMTLAKGDPFYHSSVYRGGGVATEAGGVVGGVKRARLAAQRQASDILAYRAKDKKEVTKALAYLENAVGSEYPEMEGLYKNAFTHLFSPSGGPKASRCAAGDPAACTELTANAYPKVAKKKYASPLDIRHSPDVELISRYSKAPKVSTLEGFLSRVGYPALKSLKFALPAAGIAYALSGE